MISIPEPDKVAEAVRDYNQKCYEADMKLWECRRELSNASAEGFVWAVRNWGQIQGTPGSTKAQMARALLRMELALPGDTSEAFDIQTAQLAVRRVKELMDLSQECGIETRQFSWSSKILHWIFPGQIPIYDSKVRGLLGITVIKGKEEHAYGRIVEWEYKAAQALLPFRNDVVGEVQLTTLLRAIDKYLLEVA